MWSLANSRNDETSKVRWELVGYMYGRALDLGCGPYKAFPHFIGVDSGKAWGSMGIDVQVATAEILDLFATDSCDLTYSSHLLEHIEYAKVPAALQEWCRVTKPGGHVILYLPDADHYPRMEGRKEWAKWYEANSEKYPVNDDAVEAYADLRRAKGVTKTGELYAGTPYGNPDHKWDVTYDKVIAAMETVKSGWDLVDYQVRNEKDEYSLLFVFQITQGREHKFSYIQPKPTKTAAIVRYGAIGDAIQTSSLFPILKEQGYHITLYCQAGAGHEVLMHDPHVDRFIVQGKDEVPPQFLMEFWDYTKKKYDKWINLCESVEGTLLAIPGRVNHEWPNHIRAKYCDRNYLEWTHELAEVPPPYRPKFYSTLEERAWAKDKARSYGRRNIMWSLSGSSGHKVWPHLDIIVARVMLEYPDTHIVLVGDEFCRLLESGWEDERRVHCMSGKWTIRQSMAFAEVAYLIIGTETGLLNAAGQMDVPKIVTLSHSSKEMLTKHWKNYIALEQPKGVGCPKSPCRQLHYTWDYCPKHEESGTALCQWHINPEIMWSAVQSVLGVAERKVA